MAAAWRQQYEMKIGGAISVAAKKSRSKKKINVKSMAKEENVVSIISVAPASLQHALWRKSWRHGSVKRWWQ
jgi:hypothetical protein